MAQKQILVVDDEEDIAEFLIFLLGRDGYMVEHAHHGEIALTMLTQRPWDLVVTDLMMPVLDGAELVQRIRENPQLATIPVMMLSSIPEYIVQARCASADAFLQKPFAMEQLLSGIRRLLVKSEAGRAR